MFIMQMLFLLEQKPKRVRIKIVSHLLGWHLRKIHIVYVEIHLSTSIVKSASPFNNLIDAREAGRGFNYLIDAREAGRDFN